MDAGVAGGAGGDSGVETENSNDSSWSMVSVQIAPNVPNPVVPGANENNQFLAPSGVSSESSAPPSTSATPEPPVQPPLLAAVPPSVTEDGYLGDCSSDGGNEKNFPMPPDRAINRSKCNCHPTVESSDRSQGDGSSPEAPASIRLPYHFQSGYCSHQSGGSSRKIRSIKHHHKIGPHNNWFGLKSNIAERKLRVAASMNNIELASRFLSNNVNANSSDEHQRTALHIAAAKGYDDMVNLLLRNNSDPNQKDALGNTALHLAACTNHVKVVTLLLRAGTNVATLDNNGRTPVQLAQSKLKLLQKTGGQEMAKIKSEIAGVLDMMREYLTKTGNVDEYSDLLNAFSNRFILHQTKDDITSDLQNLLDSLGSLSLQKST